MFGKQDPYITFQFLDKTLKTDVQDDAGLLAKFDEKFCLYDIQKDVLEAKRSIFKAYDEDIASSDFLGKTKPKSWVCFIQDEEVHQHEMILYDE